MFVARGGVLVLAAAPLAALVGLTSDNAVSLMQNHQHVEANKHLPQVDWPGPVPGARKITHHCLLSEAEAFRVLFEGKPIVLVTVL
jgi:hypothetical protein